MASCAVPLWAGYRPVKFRGHEYLDGGFTNNLPELYPGKTIRIQPFSTSPENAEVSPLLSYPEGRFYLRNIIYETVYCQSPKRFKSKTHTKMSKSKLHHVSKISKLAQSLCISPVPH